MKLDRGPLIRGYFITNPNKPDRLFGARWLNHFPCGSFVNAKGVTKGVTFFLIYANELNDDPRGLFKESLDLDMMQMDSIVTDAICGDLLKQVPLTTAKLNTLDPEQKQIVQGVYPSGFTTSKFLVTRNLIKMMPEWLGGTFQKAVRDRPNIWQPTMVEGIEVPNIWKCSEEILNG